MLKSDFIESIAKKLSDAVPPSLQAVKSDLERNFNAVLQSTLSKLDLVTREEFDTQAGVLAKTRVKLELMEQKVAELEAKLGTRQK